MHLTLRESEKQILRVVRTKKLISRAAIARETKLSKPVVSEGVARLINMGVLVEVKKGKSSNKGGKRPVLLSLRP
ncbi:MAG: winged helix-turn-helix transcriptional regulator, partial [Thermotogae bacterium]|nr:winged helix-turn-helix transcriptional regulator [Thermotogota bacterium]